MNEEKQDHEPTEAEVRDAFVLPENERRPVSRLQRISDDVVSGGVGLVQSMAGIASMELFLNLIRQTPADLPGFFLYSVAYTVISLGGMMMLTNEIIAPKLGINLNIDYQIDAWFASSIGFALSNLSPDIDTKYKIWSGTTAATTFLISAGPGLLNFASSLRQKK